MGKLEKIPAWQLTKVRNKKDVIEEARNKGRKVHFASLVDLCHLKNPELEPQYQKYKGRVVLRGDIVKDNSGSYAVFTEQGSSASQMTAAKVMDIISRLPGCAGQAADTVSAFTPGKNGRCSKIIENSQIGMSTHLETSTKNTKWPKSWSSMEDPVVPLGRNLYGHPLAGLLWERQFEKVLLKYGWEKIPNWECLFVHREKGLFLSVYVDDIKLARKKQNLDPMWKLLNKEVDLGKPTSFLDHVYLGCTQKECQNRKEILWIITEVSSNQGFLLGLQKNNQKQKPRRNLMKKRYLHGPMIWKFMPRNVWNDIVSWRTRRLNNYAKSRRHALTTTNSRKKTWNLLENCQTFAHRLFCNACIWFELVDLIFYGL